jgi:hypothetical protein
MDEETREEDGMRSEKRRGMGWSMEIMYILEN